MNTLDLINIGSNKLKSNQVKTSKIDSEILLSKALGKRREELLINLNQEVSEKKIKEFFDLINRRTFKEPIAYILKKKEFWSKNFEVNKNTLIPRPETELMVSKLVEIYKYKNISILDVGTGSGCIIVSLLSELIYSKGVAVDISKKALEIANLNIRNNHLDNRIKLLRKPISDIFNYKFDLIVSNPPYIAQNEIRNLDEDVRKYEPLLALNGGNDGLDVIKKVIYKAREILKINGLLALEIGNGQYNKVSKILKKNCFRINYTIKDYKSNIRCLITTLNK